MNFVRGSVKNFSSVKVFCGQIKLWNTGLEYYDHSNQLDDRGMGKCHKEDLFYIPHCDTCSIPCCMCLWTELRERLSHSSWKRWGSCGQPGHNAQSVGWTGAPFLEILDWPAGWSVLLTAVEGEDPCSQHSRLSMCSHPCHHLELLAGTASDLPVIETIPDIQTDIRLTIR
jgi:hypothetical protein